MTSNTRTDRDPRFRAFCVLWAVAHLVDVAEAGPVGWDRLPAILVVAAAVALLHRPSAVRLEVLALLQLVAFGVDVPPSSNHRLLLAAINVAILAGGLRRRADPDGPQRWMPAARATLLIAYTAAALSKYNDTFVDPSTSCATWIADKASFGLVGDPLGWPVVLGVIGIETLVPVLLLVPQTRWLGVRIGLTFHFVVSASPAAGVRDFTATLFALFVLFAAADEIAAATTRLSGWLGRRAVARNAAEFPGITATMFGLTAAWLVVASPDAMAVASWLLFTALGAVVVVVAWRTPRSPAVAIGRVRAGDSVILLAVLAVAAGPYLGLGTAPAFTPFSNLRTEAAGTNHLFMPSWHVIDHQNRVLRLESASSEELQELVEEGFGLTASSARVAADADPELVLVGRFQDSGREISGRAVQSLGAPSFWERYVLSFRPVADPERPACSA